MILGLEEVSAFEDTFLVRNKENFQSSIFLGVLLRLLCISWLVGFRWVEINMKQGLNG